MKPVKASSLQPTLEPLITLLGNIIFVTISSANKTSLLGVDKHSKVLKLIMLSLKLFSAIFIS